MVKVAGKYGNVTAKAAGVVKKGARFGCPFCLISDGTSSCLKVVGEK